MRWKKHSPEQIVAKLTRVRDAMGEGMPLPEAVRAAGISEATYFRWRAHYGELRSDQLQFIKSLELENARLRRILSVLQEHEPVSRISTPLATTRAA